MKRFIPFLLLLATPCFARPIVVNPPTLHAQVVGHSVVLTWTQPATQPPGEVVASTNVYRNGAKIKNVTPTTLTYTDSTVAGGLTYTYSLTNVDTGGVEGVTSTTASATIPATVSAPAIVTQPIDQSVTQFAQVTFTVVATGTAPLTYQWKNNGIVVAGATSASYSFQAVASNSGSLFTVVVSNSSGSVTSNPAHLTVTVATGLPNVGDMISVNAVANIRATAVANGYGTLLGTQPSGATGQVTQAPQPGPGFYWIYVTFPKTTGTPLGVSGFMGSDNMTILKPAIVITINPVTPTVLINSKTQFTANVVGSTNTAVTWSANAPNGLYTAPATPIVSTVTATSVADSSKSSSATVNVVAPPLTMDCTKVAAALGGGYSGQNVAVAVTSIPSGPVCNVKLP